MSAGSVRQSELKQLGDLRRSLADYLSASGCILSTPWRDAFERVPREVFVPRFFLDREHTGRYIVIDGSNPRQYGEWLKTVYSDQMLIIQLDGEKEAREAAAENGAVDGVPTSSSTMPSLMAKMLEALDIRDGMNILEIGTGSGYNAALLSERLGAGHVTTLEVDEALADAARDRLVSAGYAPTVKALDGCHGYAPNAPYDRIMATAAVPSIPRSWIAQARDDGLILVNLYRDLGGGALALLTVHDGEAKGQFLEDYGGFMPVRSGDPAPAFELLRRVKDAYGDKRSTNVEGQALNEPAFGFFAALRIPARRIEVEPESGPSQFWLISRDGSWAYQTTEAGGRKVAVQRGTRRLWDDLEAVHSEWTALGEPPRSAFGLTVAKDGLHLLWHTGSGGKRWELAPIRLQANTA